MRIIFRDKKTRPLLIFLILALNAFVAVTTVYASGAGGAVEEMAPFNLKTEIWRYVNFALIFAMIFFLARKPLKAFFDKHKTSVASELQEAKKAREESERKLKEYEARMAGFDQEIARIKTDAEQQKEAIREEILGEAESAIEKIMAQARQDMEANRKRALNDIRIEAAELTISLSADLLRKNMHRRDQERLIDDYLNQVGGLN